MFPDARSPSSKPGVLVTSPVVLSLGSLIPLLSEISFLCLGHGLGFALQPIFSSLMLFLMGKSAHIRHSAKPRLQGTDPESSL